MSSSGDVKVRLVLRDGQPGETAMTFTFECPLLVAEVTTAERARIMAEIERWPFKIEPDQPYTDGDTYEKGFYDGQAHAAARLAELIKRLTKP